MNNIVQTELRQLADGKIFPEAQFKDIEGAIKFLAEQEKIKNCDLKSPVYTTHMKAIMGKTDKQVIVLDENPLSVILEQHHASEQELQQLCICLQNRGINAEQILSLLNIEMGNLIETPKINISRDIIYDIASEKKFKSHIVRLFLSEYIKRTDKGFDYTFNNSNKFESHKKYIILDATTPVEIYKRLFGDRLKLVEIIDTKIQGIINQNLKLSYSKTACKKYGFKNDDDSQLVLTFKEYSKEKDYFFSLVGTNKYEGKDITIIGTPNLPPSYYQFLSKNLNLSVDNFIPQNQQVYFNGREFTYYTYSHPVLQEIHLGMIEGELLQGVHRARPTRYHVTVTVFSNFPLLQANYSY